MAASNLASRKCGPCSGKTQPLAPEQFRELLAEVPAWKLTRRWQAHRPVVARARFRRPRSTSSARIADVAEAEDHHPDLHLVDYRDVTVELWTHAVGGLTDNDFIMAAKIDALGVEEKK